MFSIYDGRDSFYQWDLDRKLIVNDDTIKQVHFCNKTDDCSLVVETYQEDGITLANVPNVLLQTNWRINVYGYTGDFTKHSACFKVNGRTKPTDYAYTETEILNWEKALGDIEAALDTIIKIQEEIINGGGSDEPDGPSEDVGSFEIQDNGSYVIPQPGLTWQEYIESYNPLIEADCCPGEYYNLFTYGYESEEDMRVLLTSHCGPSFVLMFEGTDVYIHDEVIPGAWYELGGI